MNIRKELERLAGRLHYVANGGGASIQRKQTIGQLRREIRDTRDVLEEIVSRMPRRGYLR